MNQDGSKEISVSEYWVGVDVAKDSFDAALVRPGQKYPATPLRELPHNSFKRSPEGVRALLTWLDTLLETPSDQYPIRVVMEATGNYSTTLAVWLCAQRPTLRPAIVNAYQTSAFIKSFNLRNKTDALDARALAFYGAERQPAAYEPLSPAQATLRDLSRHRDALVRQRVALTNRAKETEETAFVRQAQERLEKVFTREIKKTETQMKRIVEQSPELKRDVTLLETIYGVAFITATVILAELGDLRRFNLARQLTAYAGLCPRLFQSGSSVNGHPHLSKHGNSRARQALYLAAVTAIRGKSDLQHIYKSLIEKGKPRMVALGVIMRKLLTIMRAILISGKPYNPLWNTCGQFPLMNT